MFCLRFYDKRDKILSFSFYPTQKAAEEAFKSKPKCAVSAEIAYFEEAETLFLWHE